MSWLSGLALLAMTPAAGGLVFTPAVSIDTAAIKVHTSAGCPARADGYYAVAHGHGFPAAGLMVTTPTAAGMSRATGFDVYFAQTMKDFATDNHTTLDGRYDVSVFCVDSFTGDKFAEFAGSLTFTSPTAYQAGGAVRPSPAAPASSVAAAAPAAPAADRRPTWWLVAGLALILIAFEGGRRFGRRSARPSERTTP